MTEFEKMIEKAVDESKIGGNLGVAQVVATLAVALALKEVAEMLGDLGVEVGSLGTEAHPVITRGG